jgi:cell division protease FtsH
MEDRTYEELRHFPILDTKPAQRHAKEGRKAVELAHAAEISRIVRLLECSQSVLVFADKGLAPYLEQCLSSRMSAADWRHVTCQPIGSRPGSGPPSSAVGRLMSSLEETIPAAYTAQSAPVVVLRHLDLMTWTALEQPRPELNDVVYWLTEFPDVVKLAFWDPAYAVPKVIEELFPNRISLRVFSREVLWQIVSPSEARKVSPSGAHFTLAAQLALYQYLSGTDVVSARRVLRSIGEASFPDCGSLRDADRVFAHIRELTSPGAIQPSGDWGNVVGYTSLREELERQVRFPFTLRHEARTPEQLQQADALIPRGVILYGPPGNGKTEWAKWLARQLGATLLVIHGPELKHKLVGETEAAIRRIFADARRAAPSLILIDELDALTPARQNSQSNFEMSMVAQFLTEMDGLHRDEAVLVVGTTNRLESVDEAFKRPGRFGVRIEVGYPDEADRRLILAHYNERFALGLTENAIDYLARVTGESLDPAQDATRRAYHDAYVRHFLQLQFVEDAGPMLKQQLEERFGLGQPTRFSGDHLQGICLHLLRESLYRSTVRDDRTQLVNSPCFLELAVEAVRRRSASRPLLDVPGAEGWGSEARFR